MKRYEMKLIEGGKGVFRVSIVKDPAVESNLIYFAKETEEKINFISDEKRVIYSVVMRPGKDIFRNNVNGEPAEIFYSAKTVEQAQINYWRNKGNNQTNINHAEDAVVDGVFPFESWIVRDPKTDISSKMGMDVVEGDWIMGHKVDDEILWKDSIKTGKLDGLSVEVTNFIYELTTEKMEKNKTKDDKKSFWDELAELVNMGKEKHSKTDQTPEEIAAAEKMAADKVVVDAAAEALKMAADAAAAGGSKTPEEIAAEEKAAADAAAKEAKTPEEIAAEEKAAADKAAADKAPTPAEQILLDKIADLEATVNTLKAEKVKSETDLEEMKSQLPGGKKITNAPDAPNSIPYEEMTNAQKTRFNKENKF